VLEAHDLKDLGLKLNRMTKAGEWDQLAEQVSDDVLDLFVAAGRHDEIAGIIKQRFSASSDTIYASANSAQAADLPPDLIQDINRIETPFTGYVTD
jgi:hypothetical protein